MARLDSEGTKICDNHRNTRPVVADIHGLTEIMGTAAASSQKPFGDAIIGKSDGSTSP
jgi:hypothetical protein